LGDAHEDDLDSDVEIERRDGRAIEEDGRRRRKGT
jgi:hypothetical protein